ncbi:hypothetical protein H5410_039543 [Solanum commersonii]|uniref:Fe2OG dioxygenase domain-containing protein n=1 Tax=Solanum commersonii TaxID=4109 RepID=A0A9J5XME6_SOLCO|nr:hypothetical protein H5410_039543 [Solanum commersonii]
MTTPIIQPSISVKTLSESPNLKSIPSNYVNSDIYPFDIIASKPQDYSNSIPTVDFSLLTSIDPHQRSQAINNLNKACQEWGFFMVVNHGIQESLMKKVIDGMGQASIPLRRKLSFGGTILRSLCNPKFHSPSKPDEYSDIMWEYCEKVRQVTKVLEEYRKPELALGMPPHSDHGLLTLIIQNQVGGLQVQHQSKWIHVNALPNSLLVNTGDHLEIFSNGKYKSNVHKVVVNNTSPRISVAVAHGPSSLEAIVSPASPLVQSETNYIPMKYKDYMEMQQSNQLHQKSILEQVKIQRN